MPTPEELCCRYDPGPWLRHLILQPWIVILMGPGRLAAVVAGTGAPGVGVATATSAAGGPAGQRPGGQADEQVADLIAGERDQLGRWWVADALEQGGHDQEGMGEQGQGHPGGTARPPAGH